ncbi:MAG TPA: hypothetical protein VF275_07635 [Gammaproteobacteria bacterium]
MIKKVLIASALLGLSTAAVAGPSTGDWEIVFSNAGGGLEINSDITALGVGVRAGYFLDSVHEVGFGTDLSYFDNGVANGESLDLAGFYRYNFATSESKEWCYGGVSLDLRNVTDSDASSEWIRPHFGKKWMLSEDVAFDLNGGVNIPTDSDIDARFDVRFGLSIFY